MALDDFLRAIAYLATCITNWTVQCDKDLLRLICYVNSTLHLRHISWCGDAAKDIVLRLYADADFAGDQATMRSTSGVFLCLRGPNTFMPLGAVSKKQTCVSHSTPEAEIVAFDCALRTVGLPALQL